MKRWFSDLALGVRLALGGGRTSWVRLVLTGAGIGLGVAVLLAASSVPTIFAERAERSSQQAAIPGEADDRALYLRWWITEYRAETVDVRYMMAGGPQAPVPPGIPAVPGDGEMYVSPALRELLDSPEGELLRERFPQKVIGSIGDNALTAPHDLVAMVGDPRMPRDSADPIARFGGPTQAQDLGPLLTLLVIVGCVVLLFPILVFVGISTRLAGAQRDRRLAALRLVGAGAQRVRRIAAGEALLGAVIGLAVGTGLFMISRRFVEDVRLLGLSVFTGDLTPVPWLAVLISALVPVLAVVTSVLAMRRTVVEPLGVVRHTKPVRRVLWWRLVPIALGTVALLTQAGSMGESSGGAGNQEVLIGGIVLLLLGIPTMLPWVVERSVSRLRGGAPSWQLAIRRLQLESGTAARVVGGVAVVLAGAIALQSVLTSVSAKIIEEPLSEADRGKVHVSLRQEPQDLAPQAVGMLERAEGVKRVHTTQSLAYRTDTRNYQGITIGTCEAMTALTALPDCQDGDAFMVVNQAATGNPAVAPGTTVTAFSEDEEITKSWTVPQYELVRAEIVTRNTSGLFLTPAAVRGADLPPGRTQIMVELDQSKADAVEHVRNAVAPLTWRTFVSFVGEIDMADRVVQFMSVRQALLAGSLITLLLAGASLLVLALEQVRERRRPLAVLAASGVPRGALGRSLLWQNAVPLLLALVVSTAVGTGLAALLLRVLDLPVALDWGGIGLLSVAAAGLGLVVTALTLPSLRRATGALGLRSE
ncbi:ABC transporter permease [Saccharothrix coeruleofusca]|uniref:ABC3 transporter permease C-terminal domain-containing protein n=1 Tax=Saccharothrix coeruleofusca TaxID=33919 RepID=A0A918EDD9_9PSEU|nr:FtsX-like permease family protein [Saccharothrix coeruleofusca]GGP56660.1 hypothetical protein GCM10010185_31120 [Saccharothrix coeruleofusca]